MNIDDHVSDCLHFFAEEVSILGDILFVGAWARYFYRDLFKHTDKYTARLATKDLDILISPVKKRGKREIDVHASLLKAGYEPRFYRNGLIKYFRDDLELEFLLPAKGNAQTKPVSINAYNLKAQELSHIQMLWHRPVSVCYGKFLVNVPNPFDYAVHKMIISYRRSKKESGEQDRRDAEEVLYALSEQKEFAEDFRTTICELPKKSAAALKKGIQEMLDPFLREKLEAMLNNEFKK